MAIRWNARLSVGVPVIDAQHQGIVRRAAALMAAMQDGRGERQVARMLRYLAAYTATHFAAEESLMMDRVYPDIEAHAAEHDALRARVRALHRRLTDEGVTPTVATELNTLVCGWIYDHIGTADRALADWLREHAPRKRHREPHPARGLARA